ncbi:Histidine kinase-, DNA gyrase B-, and HSP90-like ATPase [Variovorax sp. YR216]|nr:Histidine kinase-, DNA gyrase B-, and HSP90-like ATPase [Variovorax sp. YR216]
MLQLVMNANTAMPDGGRLLFRASVERHSCTEGTSLEVVDTGTGMSAAILLVAALPFFTTKERSALSGMGLPAVAGFAAQSGGHMDMTSVVGVGTTVTLKLPTFERRVEHSSEKVSEGARLC